MQRALRGAILTVMSAACGTTEPTAYLVRYELRSYACPYAGCGAGDTTGVSSADLGDTVWLFHRISLEASAAESTLVTLRPTCAANLTVLRANTAQRTVPATVTCPDSTYRVYLKFATLDVRYTPWVVDSGLTAGTYQLQGRVLVQPAAHPQLVFEIR